MDTIIIYDISENGLRARVAKVLLDYGCVRIQKSAFWGMMNHNTQDKLRLRLERMMDDKEGNIQFYPMCSKCFSLKESIGEIYEVREEDVSVF